MICKRLLIAATAAAVLPIAGCTVGPDYKHPEIASPSAWATPTTRPFNVPTTQASTVTTDATDVGRWWANFHDPTLNKLVNESINLNLTVQQAEARLYTARATRATVDAGLFPSVTASATGTRGQNSNYNNLQGGARTANLFNAGFDAAWELDVFGGVRRAIEAADADVQAAVEDRRDALVSTTAEVATTYLQLRGYQRRIAIAKDNVTIQQHNADIVRKRFEAGYVSQLDVADANAQMASTQSAIAPLESAERQAIYALSVLLGKNPGDLTDELLAQAPIPSVPPTIPVGLPSDLLRRRPDVRRAEAQLHAANAQIGVATADLYPQFSITGNLGTQSNKARTLFNYQSHYYSIGPSVNWTIFDAGKIRANIELNKGLTREALFTYRLAVLTALQDAENALIAYAKEQEHRQALIAAVVAYRQAVTVATELYRNGQTDFLNVVTAEGSLYGAEDALVQSDQTVASNLVALYKALGGGWEYVGDVDQ